MADEKGSGKTVKTELKDEKKKMEWNPPVILFGGKFSQSRSLNPLRIQTLVS